MKNKSIIKTQILMREYVYDNKTKTNIFKNSRSITIRGMGVKEVVERVMGGFIQRIDAKTKKQLDAISVEYKDNKP
jgi:hypothetical protein